MKRVKREDKNNDGLSDGDEEEEYDEEDEEDAGLFKNQTPATSAPVKIQKSVNPVAAPTQPSTIKVEASAAAFEEEKDPVKEETPNPSNEDSDDSEHGKEIVQKIEDSEDSDEPAEPVEVAPDDIIVGQWEKDVTRTKSKFKLQLVDVMIRINGKDFILKKLGAEIQY